MNRRTFLAALGGLVAAPFAAIAGKKQPRHWVKDHRAPDTWILSDVDLGPDWGRKVVGVALDRGAEHEIIRAQVAALEGPGWPSGEKLVVLRRQEPVEMGSPLYEGDFEIFA